MIAMVVIGEASARRLPRLDVLLSAKQDCLRVKVRHTIDKESNRLAAGKLSPVLNVGREVRRWRQTRGLTLAQVGEQSGLNIGYLSQIENAKAVPSLEALAAIAAAIDVPAAWVLRRFELGTARRPRGRRPRAEVPGRRAS